MSTRIWLSSEVAPRSIQYSSGPHMLHMSFDLESFYTFLSCLVPRLEGAASPVFGADEEYALRKGLQAAFPEAEIITYKRHLKNNLVQYFQDKMGANTKVHNSVVHRVFGTDGLMESPITVRAAICLKQLLMGSHGQSPPWSSD